jgi:hypothetical protein
MNLHGQIVVFSRHLTERQWDAIVRRVDKEYPEARLAELAYKLRCSRCTIQRSFKRLGIRRSPGRPRK